MNIPWRLKSAAFSVIDVVGDGPLYFAQKYITRRAAPRGGVISPNWLFHQKAIREHGSKRVLEFGAGKDLVQNLFLAQDGIEQTVVDLFDMLDLSLVNGAIANLDLMGVPTKGAVHSRADLKTLYRIDYIAPLDMANTPFADGAFDACISTNTLEHIPRQVIAAIWQECKRVICAGGFVSAKIDYSDHYAHTDRALGPLNYLRFTEAEWQRFNYKNHYQNRMRHQHHLDLLIGAGFEIVSELATEYAEPPAVVVPEAVTGNDTDYAQTGFLVARRPQ